MLTQFDAFALNYFRLKLQLTKILLILDVRWFG